MKKRRISFKWVYLIYVVLLAALVTAAVMSMRALLREYEQSQPEQQVWQAAEQLAAAAADGSFQATYHLADAQPNRFEQEYDLHAEYLSRYSGALEVAQQSIAHAEDERYYHILRDGLPLAQVKLKAAGPAVTKLAVFSLREWTVESITPLFEAHDYTLCVPASFSVQLNGISLTDADSIPKGERQREYSVSGLYLAPNFSITDREGNPARYTLKNGQVIVEFFDYSLTLPSALTVEVNGSPYPGEAADGDLIRYDITCLSKPEVFISDLYGNRISYEGGDELPLTYRSIVSDRGHTVLVDGTPVPDQAISSRINPDYILFSDYVPNLPQICTYCVAVLQEDAEITVTDASGAPVSLEEGRTVCDLTGPGYTPGPVPAEVASQVDVLQIAQNWSLFMTDDLPFDEIKPHLIASSYQYNVAVKYATGIDIKFTSKHTLDDPAFTDISVENFTWISENCFSVDISFVKHMRLYYGTPVLDPMNDRFYFVRYDDTNNGVNDPAWKLASMKEIINNAGT